MARRIIAVSTLLAAANAGLKYHSKFTKSIYRHYAMPGAQYPPVTSAHNKAPVVKQHAPVADNAAPTAEQHAPIPNYIASESEYSGHETHSHPKYDFMYSVLDPQSVDHKSQNESHDSDAVHGSYSQALPDGSVRKVEYTTDDHRGFIASVPITAPLVQPETEPEDSHDHH